MNTKLSAKAKNNLTIKFFKDINNLISSAIMENVKKHRDIKLVITNRKRRRLLADPNYHTTKWF